MRHTVNITFYKYSTSTIFFLFLSPFYVSKVFFLHLYLNVFLRLLISVCLLLCVNRRRRFERDIMRRSWAINCDEVFIPTGMSSSSHASGVASVASI